MSRTSTTQERRIKPTHVSENHDVELDPANPLCHDIPTHESEKSDMEGEMAIDRTSEDYRAGKAEGFRIALGLDLSPTERLLLAHWLKKKNLTPQAKVAEELGLCRTAVPTALTGLVAKGFLIRETGKPGDPSIYKTGPALTGGGQPPIWKPKRKTALEKADTGVSEKADA